MKSAEAFHFFNYNGLVYIRFAAVLRDFLTKNKREAEKYQIPGRFSYFLKLKTNLIPKM